MSIFDQATSMQAAVLRRYAGVRAKLSRGSYAAVSIVVVPGRTEAELADDDNVITRMSTDDFNVAVGDYTANGQQVTPQGGDRLTVDGVVYEVMDLSDGCYRFTDQTRTEYRVHTRRIATP